MGAESTPWEVREGKRYECRGEIWKSIDEKGERKKYGGGSSLVGQASYILGRRP